MATITIMAAWEYTKNSVHIVATIEDNKWKAVMPTCWYRSRNSGTGLGWRSASALR